MFQQQTKQSTAQYFALKLASLRLWLEVKTCTRPMLLKVGVQSFEKPIGKEMVMFRQPTGHVVSQVVRCTRRNEPSEHHQHAVLWRARDNVQQCKAHRVAHV